MSDLIKRLRAASNDERLSTGMLYREAADALESPAHAWLMVAADKVGNEACSCCCSEDVTDFADHVVAELEKLASEYPPSVCVPVEPTEEMIKAAIPPSSEEAQDWDAVKIYKAMLTAARKP